MKRFSIILLTIAVALMAGTQSVDAKGKKTKRRTTATSTAGIVRRINASQFSSLVADYNYAPNRFKGTKVTVVNFYSTTCGPCRIQEQILDALASQYGSRVNFYALDVNQCMQVVAAYGIKSVPTTLLFSPSGKSATATGVIWPQDLANAINSFF